MNGCCNLITPWPRAKPWYEVRIDCRHRGWWPLDGVTVTVFHTDTEGSEDAASRTPGIPNGEDCIRSMRSSKPPAAISAPMVRWPCAQHAPNRRRSIIADATGVTGPPAPEVETLPALLLLPLKKLLKSDGIVFREAIWDGRGRAPVHFHGLGERR